MYVDGVVGWVVTEPSGVLVQYLQLGPSFSSVRRVGYRPDRPDRRRRTVKTQETFWKPLPVRLRGCSRKRQTGSLLANRQVSRMINMTIVFCRKLVQLLAIASPRNLLVASSSLFCLCLCPCAHPDAPRDNEMTPGGICNQLQKTGIDQTGGRDGLHRVFVCFYYRPDINLRFQGNVLLHSLQFYFSFELSRNEVRMRHKVIWYCDCRARK